MRFAVESWSPEYGAPVDADLEPTTAAVDPEVEVRAADWAPVAPDGTAAAGCVRFVDGVRRIDARVWVLDGAGAPAHPAVAASWAAGVVACDGPVARAETCTVRRALFSAAPDLAAVVTASAHYGSRGLDPPQAADLVAQVQQSMRALEVEVAQAAPAADLVVVDGPLREDHRQPGLVGYVKTHHTTYLPAELLAVVAALRPGGRTPLFRIGGPRARLSWYLRLPGGRGHGWAGVVRCEVAGDRVGGTAGAAALADRTAATLPRFASTAHKDTRAPQNLTPIAGLERQLRHRLGDPLVLYRALAAAAGS